MITATILVLLGAAGLFFVSRREFYRRNASGIEEFGGFTGMLATKFLERILRTVSVLLLLAGATLFAISLMRG
ncbi:hypothetical protein [Noviherbaspirillum sp. ST9]|uniref:hypothetical protein n=1 Tax=Noviherbaspirillum sp. ST9 TaxID=3401606 RepID=UPI003B588418